MTSASSTTFFIKDYSRLPVFWVNLYSILVNLYSKFKFNDSRMLLSADAYEYEQQAKPR